MVEDKEMADAVASLVSKFGPMTVQAILLAHIARDLSMIADKMPEFTRIANSLDALDNRQRFG